MPTYEYLAVVPEDGCARCRKVFEIRQSIHDQALTKCPQCGGPIQRVVSVCTIATRPSARSMLSDKNLKAKGFTKLVNEGGGRFRKTT